MLVDYSDSESEGETAPAPTPAPAPKTGPAKPGFQTASGKIKVDLPTIRPEPGAAADEPPAKRARIGGGGINSFLPAPKRTAQNAPKKGVSLKTSSEAAFSREMPAMPQYDEPTTTTTTSVVEEKKEEPKLFGKATRFLPLSVSNKKKKKPVLPKAPPVVASKAVEQEEVPKAQEAEPKPKPKRSLFSVQQEEPELPEVPPTDSYEPLIRQEEHPDAPPEPNFQEKPPTNPNSLSSAAEDLNLTPAQRRHLFGRGGNKDINITHFNMDSEYANNEKMRQAGEVTAHRAVKAIAPGKHSLAQLVNNAKTQKDGLEDAWAEGKRNRGEGASKYGWG